MMSDSLEEVISPERVAAFSAGLPAPLEDRRVVFALYGRNALFSGLRAIAARTNKRTVLVPDMNCGVEVETAVAAGFNVVFYPVDPIALQVSSKCIGAHCNGNTAAVVLTHYFGFPQQSVVDVAELCREVGGALIEDCAHGLGSDFNGRPLGTIGDMSIFSLRKAIPVPHGGALFVRDPEMEVPAMRQPPPEAVDFDSLIYFSQRHGLFRAGVSIDAIYRHLGREIDHFGPRLAQYGGYELGLSRLAQALIQVIDVSQLLRRRQAAFRSYAHYFSHSSTRMMRPLYGVCPDSVFPPFYPIVSALDSECTYQKLQDTGCRAPIPFWSINQRFTNLQCSKVLLDLRRRLMILPLAEPLTESELDHVIQVLEGDL